jgi:hypothetical protein
MINKGISKNNVIKSMKNNGINNKNFNKLKSSINIYSITKNMRNNIK